MITGVICGYRIEEIVNPLTQQVRWLDKLVDELAKGKKDGAVSEDSAKVVVPGKRPELPPPGSRKNMP